MSARADARLAIVIAAMFLVAPTAVWAAKDHTPSAAHAQQILEQNRPLANNGDASAQYNMGVLYDRGYGVKRDYAKARHWYEKAATQHYARAEHNLGIMYEAGKGVPHDSHKAAHWFRRGADDGQTASQNNLAVLYMKGEGVPQNTGKAAFWAAKAAAGGNSAAIDNLPRIIARLPHIHVNADDVNVRDQPNRESRVVGHADSDTVAVVLSRRDDWTQVLLPDDYTLGWVANFLLSDSQAPLAGHAMPKSEPASSKPADTGSTVASRNASTPEDDSAGPAEASASSATRPQTNTKPTQAAPPAHGSAKDGAVDRWPQSGPVATPRQVTPKPEVDKTTSAAQSSADKSKPADPSEQPTNRPLAGPKQSHPTPSTASSKAPSPRVTAPTPSGASQQAGPKTAKAKVESKAAATKPESKPAPKKSVAPTHATVGVDAANLRAKAAGGARVIGQLHRGDRVELLDEHNGWRYVRTAGGMKGWVAGYLLGSP